MSTVDEMSSARPPVAIVGMAVLLPGAPDLGTYWRNLTDGGSTPSPRSRPGVGTPPSTTRRPPATARTGCTAGAADSSTTWPRWR
ncbi:beta-ketoacyl synthase N-terminal-like domain-containing protein [Streptomyces thioluteus]|uniref:beta-ketoacyl synthase N-terminal-like domain-containing protein n=1 Tax=Streptomyces thioluteus TaxID=66431 RepID=UPI0031ED18FA